VHCGNANYVGEAVKVGNSYHQQTQKLEKGRGIVNVAPATPVLRTPVSGLIKALLAATSALSLQLTTMPP